MSISVQWRTAKQLFKAGQSLFEEHRYAQALVELHKAEENFRDLDARGHPRKHPLENGVSGLANTLSLLGRCYEELGQYHKALTCYETSRVNEKFERKKPFRVFLGGIRQNLISCYKQEVAKIDEGSLRAMLTQDVPIDPTYVFPFSLNPNAIPVARLYELAPEACDQFKDFYFRASSADAAVRKKAGKDLDEIRMKRVTFSIWLIFGLLWLIYSMIVVDALLQK